jgi:AmmeMemoRadiSam system protein B
VVRVRKPTVAGSFYPGETQVLRNAVGACLAAAREALSPESRPPKALIVPHAGYVYSGEVAAHAFVRLEPWRDIVRRVVLIGPSHRVAFDGLAVPSHAAFDTPLGRVPIDDDARHALLSRTLATVRDDAHRWEHSLEVQLPFLQEVLESFVVLPIAVGHASPAEVTDALEASWGGDETVIIISSDLSHYHDYATAKRMDGATAAAIETLRPNAIGPEDACGRIAVQGFLESAKTHALHARTLDLRSSGDTAGERLEVVGYGAWAFTVCKNGSA